jgi:hypothetical protein
MTGLRSTCAWCGQEPTSLLQFEARGERFELDLCPRHLEEVLKGAKPRYCRSGKPQIRSDLRPQQQR